LDEEWSECGNCNCGDCACCCDSCDCDSDDSDDEEEEEPNTDAQLSLNLDNKMQSLDWSQVKVNIHTLLNHLFKSRRPALAMAIRRDNNEFGFTEIPFGSLCNYTTKDDAHNIYSELNP
jgi:hypothetical protein